MLVSQPVAQSPTAGRSVADGTLAAASGGVGLLGGHSGHPVAGCAHRVVSRGGRRILLSEPRRQRGGLAPHPVPPRGCSPGAFSPSAPRWAGGRRARVLAPPPHSGSHFRVPRSWAPPRLRPYLYRGVVSPVRGQGLHCHRQRPSVTCPPHRAIPELLGESGQTPSRAARASPLHLSVPTCKMGAADSTVMRRVGSLEL